MASKSSASPPFKIISNSESNFQFKIDYSKLKDLRVGQYISSPTFAAGGYDWVLNFYPQGTLSASPSDASLILGLRSRADDITVKYSFKLLSKTDNAVIICQGDIDTFSCYKEQEGGDGLFISKDKLKDLYREKDFVVISCDIRVLSEPQIVKNYPGGWFEHIEKLWERGERFDVTFEVEGENISAHRFMLATRSPVFEAILFGPMAEANMNCIKIDEMKAEVFKTLLHFVYTDRLVVDASGKDKTAYVELLQGLFVAADRYALEKLTILCEEQLANNFSVDTVVRTLLFADRHSCVWLKKKCLEFASSPRNFSLVALTEEYLHIMLGSLSLFSELRDKVKSSIATKTRWLDDMNAKWD